MENDKYIKCRGDSELFKYTKRGVEVYGGSPTSEINKKNGKKITIVTLGVWIWKGVQKGGQHSSMFVPTIYTMMRGSDALNWGQICIFWHSHCVSSHIATRPPFAPPFSSFRFMKNIRCQIFPESKIKFVRLLGQDIQRFELQKLIFSARKWQTDAKNGIS